MIVGLLERQPGDGRHLSATEGDPSFRQDARAKMQLILESRSKSKEYRKLRSLNCSTGRAQLLPGILDEALLLQNKIAHLRQTG